MLFRSDNIAGSYIHGIFDSCDVVKIIVKSLLKQKGLNKEVAEDFDLREYKNRQYDILASSVRNTVDIEKIYRIMGLR